MVQRCLVLFVTVYILIPFVLEVLGMRRLEVLGQYMLED